MLGPAAAAARTEDLGRRIDREEQSQVIRRLDAERPDDATEMTSRSMDPVRSAVASKQGLCLGRSLWEAAGADPFLRPIVAMGPLMPADRESELAGASASERIEKGSAQL